MIIVMSDKAGEYDIAGVVGVIRAKGLREHISRGDERTIIGAVGDERVFHVSELENLPGVEKVIRVLDTWKLVGREAQSEDAVIVAKGVAFGGGNFVDVGTDQADDADAAIFFDPFYASANPYDVIDAQDERQRVKRLVRDVADAHERNKPVLVRVRDMHHIEYVLNACADILYLGGELMSNRILLNEAGNLNIPLVLCKDKHHLVEDWLDAAEYVAQRGNRHIILGEAGVLSFDKDHPYRLDIESIVKVRRVSHLPVVANIGRLWHNDMPHEVLYQLAKAAGVCGVIGRR